MSVCVAASTAKSEPSICAWLDCRFGGGLPSLPFVGKRELGGKKRRKGERTYHPYQSQTRRAP